MESAAGPDGLLAGLFAVGAGFFASSAFLAAGGAVGVFDYFEAGFSGAAACFPLSGLSASFFASLKFDGTPVSLCFWMAGAILSNTRGLAGASEGTNASLSYGLAGAFGAS